SPRRRWSSPCKAAWRVSSGPASACRPVPASAHPGTRLRAAGFPVSAVRPGRRRTRPRSRSRGAAQGSCGFWLSPAARRPPPIHGSWVWLLQLVVRRITSDCQRRGIRPSLSRTVETALDEDETARLQGERCLGHDESSRSRSAVVSALFQDPTHVAAVGGAGDEMGAVGHQELVVAVLLRLHLAYMLQVDQYRAVDAHEAGIGHPLLDVLHALADAQPLSRDGDLQIVAFGLHVEDAGHVHRPDAAADLHQEPGLAEMPVQQRGETVEICILVGCRRDRIAAADQAACATYGPLEAGHVEGLQKVVDRLYLESLGGVFAVGGGEDHVGTFATKRLQDVEAIELRHLDVQEHEVRALLAYGREGLDTVLAGPQQLQIAG